MSISDITIIITSFKSDEKISNCLRSIQNKCKVLLIENSNDLEFKKWHNTFWDNLSTSIELHKIDKLIVINHRDCGAAKIANTNKEFNDEIEEEIHTKSFKKIKDSLRKRHPSLSIELNLISLDKTIKTYG